MAKGQKRSNREIRKPKQEKVPAKPESTFGNQIKQVTSPNIPRRQDKRWPPAGRRTLTSIFALHSPGWDTLGTRRAITTAGQKGPLG